MFPRREVTFEEDEYHYEKRRVTIGVEVRDRKTVALWKSISHEHLVPLFLFRR